MTGRAAAQPEIPRWQSEIRVGALAGRTTAWQASAGANVVIGTYVRLALLAGGGARRDAGAWDASGSVDAIIRFHLDPFREYRYGLYMGGGAAALFDENATGRARAVIVVGYEHAKPGRRWLTGIEAGYGGGLRVAVSIKRARAFAR